MVKINPIYRKAIETQLKKNKLESDLIDIKSEWDSTLDYNENIQNLKEQGYLKATVTYDDYEHGELEYEQQQVEQEEKKTIEAIKKSKSSKKLEDYFSNMKEHIRMLSKGYLNGLILLSNGGLGKSRQTFNVLNEEKLEKGEDYELIKSFSTPLELYHLLYQNRDKILIFDDCHGLLNNPIAVSLLKSALDDSTNTRIIHYLTTSSKLKVPNKFVFTGKVIILANRIPKNPEFDSLKSRCVYYELRFKWKEIIEIMYEIAKQPYKNLSKEERFNCVEFIRGISTPATSDLSLRHLFRVFEAYRYSRITWKDISNTYFQADEKKLFIYEKVKAGEPIEEIRKAFNQHFSYALSSKSTFYKIKKEME